MEEEKKSVIDKFAGAAEGFGRSVADKLGRKFAQPGSMEQQPSLLNRGSFKSDLKTTNLDSEARENLTFMNSVDAALHNTGHPMAYIVSLGVGLFFILFLIWASFASLDEVTRGQGTVVPSQRVQVIQNLREGFWKTFPFRKARLLKKARLWRLLIIREFAALLTICG